MCAYTVAWNEATPAGSSTNANTIDTEFHNLKISIRERMDNILHSSGDWGTDGEEPKLVDIAALAGTPVVANLVHDANQTAGTGADLTLAWNTETLDTGGLHDTSTNNDRITIVTAGYYRIIAQIHMQAGANSADINIYLRKNGSNIRVSNTPVINGDNTQLIISEIVLAAATDYYNVIITQSSGVNMTVLGGSTGNVRSSFQIEKLNGTT